jgi:hypothetical protein
MSILLSVNLGNGETPLLGLTFDNSGVGPEGTWRCTNSHVGIRSGGRFTRYGDILILWELDDKRAWQRVMAVGRGPVNEVLAGTSQSGPGMIYRAASPLPDPSVTWELFVPRYQGEKARAGAT